MIRIVERIYVHDLDTQDYAELPVVPASATIDKNVEYKKNGRVTTYKLSCNLLKEIPAIYHNVVLKAVYDRGKPDIIGTEEMPVRLSVERSNLIKATASWSF